MTYSATLSPVPSDLTIATIDSASRTLTYVTSDFTHEAVYTVTISAYDSTPTLKASMTYQVDFHDPCLDVVPAIDPTILSEADLIFDYVFFQGDFQETLDAAKVTSPETTTTCPAIEVMELRCQIGGVY